MKIEDSKETFSLKSNYEFREGVTVYIKHITEISNQLEKRWQVIGGTPQQEASDNVN